MNDDVLKMLVSATSLNVNCSGRLPETAALKNAGIYGEGFLTVMLDQKVTSPATNVLFQIIHAKDR